MELGTAATDINKVCASGMKSLMISAQSIMLGHRKVMVAGGMENMSQTPHYAFLRKPVAYGDGTFPDSIKFDGLTDVYNKILMGSCTEKIVTDLGISRQA
jgi:acetyl-CoA C-acetyltransferase